uniref:Uncharacterized protein n=1 Tax=Arundo donax TaxID=35708 RepID=A0A0A9GNU6_ARUDO
MKVRNAFYTPSNFSICSAVCLPLHSLSSCDDFSFLAYLGRIIVQLWLLTV